MKSLAQLGARLRRGGLVPRALAAWAGTDRLSALPAMLPRGQPPTPASTLLALFVAGEDVPVDRVRDLAALHHHKLVELRGDVVHACVAILPLGQALLVCDRLDTSDSLDIVCWPDDSSYHLALSLPAGRTQRWLDLGTGSAFAPLLRPDLAHQIVGTDLNPRAVRYAWLGIELSGIAHVAAIAADLGDGIAPDLRHRCQLVTCNAPIPVPAGEQTYRARWRSSDTAFIARCCVHARTFVAPDGLVVIHAALEPLEAALDELDGHRVIVTYTPPEARGFAVAWWRPDGEHRRVRARRLLSDAQPHLTYNDRLAALTGST